MRNLRRELGADEVKSNSRCERLRLDLRRQTKISEPIRWTRGAIKVKFWLASRSGTGQRRRDLLAEEGIKDRRGNLERRLEPGRHRNAHHDFGALAQFARQERDVLVSAVFDEIAELEAVEQRLDRVYECCPLRLIGRLEVEINLQSRLRLGQGRKSGASRYSDSASTTRAAAAAHSREPCT